MLRKAVLITCTLLLSSSLVVFSEQSGEQKPIEQQLKEAMCLRNTGIVITSAGIALATVGGLSFFIGLGGLLHDPAIDPSTLFTVFAIADGIGAVCIVVGPILWSRGARQLRNIKKSQVALQLLGPDLAERESLAGIALVCNY